MIDIQSQISKKVGLGTLFIKGYIEKDNFLLYKELYERYQFLMGGFEGEKKSAQDFSKKFIKLIDDFKENGFDSRFPITVSPEGVAIDGHHRIACCLYFNVNPKYKIEDSVSIKKYNGLSWILGNFFIYHSYSEFEKVIIMKEYCKYNKIYYYDSVDYVGEKDDILGKLHINYKGEKIKIIFTNILSENNQTSQLIKEIFSKDIRGEYFSEHSKLLSTIIIYTYHIYNRLKRKIFELIKNILKQGVK